MNVDMADVGNLVLGVGTSVGAYIAASDPSVKGIALSVLVISISGVIKAFCSAVDNYKYKKSQVVLPTLS